MSRYNMKGWNWKKWVSANKNNLRLIVSGVFGLFAVGVSGLTAPWAVTLGGAVTVLSKLILDSLDFFVSE